MAADEGDCPGLVTWIICHSRPASALSSLIHIQRGVHTAPVFLECRLSAPPSTKETLTAINYHAGRTRAIPLGFSSDPCLRSQTPPGLAVFDKRAGMFCPGRDGGHGGGWDDPPPPNLRTLKWTLLNIDR